MVEAMESAFARIRVTSDNNFQNDINETTPRIESVENNHVFNVTRNIAIVENALGRPPFERRRRRECPRRITRVAL